MLSRRSLIVEIAICPKLPMKYIPCDIAVNKTAFIVIRILGEKDNQKFKREVVTNESKIWTWNRNRNRGIDVSDPYSSLDEVIELSVLAEKLGFDAVWGNDHLTTQSYVWDEFQKQPRYYAPLLTLAAIARETKTLKVATALLVIPFRHPLVVAKELVTWILSLRADCISVLALGHTEKNSKLSLAIGQRKCIEEKC